MAPKILTTQDVLEHDASADCGTSRARPWGEPLLASGGSTLPHEGELLTTSLDAEGRRKLRASHESDATIRYDAFASSEPPSSISPSQLAEVASSPAGGCGTFEISPSETFAADAAEGSIVSAHLIRLSAPALPRGNGRATDSHNARCSRA